jgi:hypothetical protein|tara:strand:- start:3314 stop:3724 length:411 start_codon:yes stop_codon:yes gene_type:complete
LRFKTLTGSTRKIIGPHKYSIDWDGVSKSKFQKSVKDFLEEYWSSHVVFEEFPIAGTRMTFDFYNANEKIAIEVQGGQHTRYVPFFHGKYKNNYLMQLKRDHQKHDFCELNNIKLVEIYEKDIISKDLFKKFDISL